MERRGRGASGCVEGSGRGAAGLRIGSAPMVGGGLVAGALLGLLSFRADLRSGGGARRARGPDGVPRPTEMARCLSSKRRADRASPVCYSRDDARPMQPPSGGGPPSEGWAERWIQELRSSPARGAASRAPRRGRAPCGHAPRLRPRRRGRRPAPVGPSRGRPPRRPGRARARRARPRRDGPGPRRRVRRGDAPRDGSEPHHHHPLSRLRRPRVQLVRVALRPARRSGRARSSCPSSTAALAGALDPDERVPISPGQRRARARAGPRRARKRRRSCTPARTFSIATAHETVEFARDSQPRRRVPRPSRPRALLRAPPATRTRPAPASAPPSSATARRASAGARAAP